MEKYMKTEKRLFIPKTQTAGHHGDLVWKRITKLPEGVEKIKKRPLALGEMTGHKHVAVADDIEFFEDSEGRTYIKSMQPVTIRHEKDGQWTGEHNTEVLDPHKEGLYQVTIKRTYDYLSEEIENVRD